jgi:hypothetical protein
MSFLAKLMPAKALITSDSIRAEIVSAQSEIDNHRVKLAGAMDGVALMNDSEHVAAEASIAATKRAIARLESKVAHLTTELPNAIAKEEAAAKTAADEALRQRAESSRKANTVEAKKLLNEYNIHAAKVAGILAQLKGLADEANAINVELGKNPVADAVPSYEHVHRVPSRRPRIVEKRKRPVWVWRDAPPRGLAAIGGVYEHVEDAKVDLKGDPIPVNHSPHYGSLGNMLPQPSFEVREIEVEVQSERSFPALHGLSDVRLPPAFADGSGWHWPRRS